MNQKLDHVEHKWRFVDVRAFIFSGVIRMMKVDNLREVDYVAISYTWSEDMVGWRQRMVSSKEEYGYEEKLARGSFDISISERTVDPSIFRAHLFFTVMASLVLTQNKNYLWMDIVCIDQDNQAEKEYFVSRMGSLYSNASVTHAYRTGSKILPTVACQELYFPIWETRAWTIQEHMLSNEALFCYVFDGDAKEDVMRAANASERPMTCRTLEVRSLMVDKCEILDRRESGYIQVMEGKGKVTCVVEGDDPFGGGLPLSAFLNVQIAEMGDWSQITSAVGRGTFCKTQFSAKHQDTTREMRIRICMMLLAGRKSTVPEDMLYSVLGILEMEEYHVHYGVGFEEARLAVFEAMESDVLTITLGTDWGCNQNTDNKDSALPRVVGSDPTIGIELLDVTARAEYSRDSGTCLYSRIEKFRIWKDTSRPEWKYTAVVRALLGSNVSILCCVSLSDNPDFLNIPIATIPREEVHVVIVGGSRTSEEDYWNTEAVYDTTALLVEIGNCSHHVVFPDVILPPRTALLTLECEETPSGYLRNKGAALVMDASSLSSDHCLTVVE